MALLSVPSKGRQISARSSSPLVNPTQVERVKSTHMREDLLRQPTPRRFLKALVEAQDSPAAFETISRHLELVHGVYILHMHLYARPIGCLCRPEV